MDASIRWEDSVAIAGLKDRVVGEGGQLWWNIWDR